MRRPAILCVIFLIALAWFSLARPLIIQEIFVVSAKVPLDDVQSCLRVYGKNVAPDFEPIGTGSDLGGSGFKGGLSPPGATFQSASGKIRATLRPASDRYELVVRAEKSLSPSEFDIFRQCAAGARVIPSWDQIADG